MRNHMEGIVAWAQTRQTNGFLEALNGLQRRGKSRHRAPRHSIRWHNVLIGTSILKAIFKSHQSKELQNDV